MKRIDVNFSHNRKRTEQCRRDFGIMQHRILEETVTIRIADSKRDGEQLLEIYTPYVTDTAISFEYETPSLKEFQNRIQCTLEHFPYLVAEMEGRILGYAYATAFKNRAAYDWSVETTVYVRMGCHRSGIGRRLYQALEEILKKQNILNANACIAYTGQLCPYLPEGSEKFHLSMGYQRAAFFTKSGYKFGTWYDMIWMEKLLDIHPRNPHPVIPFARIAKDVPDGL